jgi:hypothetical protein
MIIKTKYTLAQKVAGWLLWMSPAFLLIFLVATQRLNFLVAIALITLFHFIAFYGIIKFYQYTGIEKKK